MRTKLQTFTDFSNTLLPHETSYLLAVQQMEDKVKLGILERVHTNSLRSKNFEAYDTHIDKRKYSLLKSWIQKQLRAIDVDVRYAWMCEMEKRIITDSIELKEEKLLLKAIRHYTHPSFYFPKFYELAARYRHFLLIRMRYEDHALVESFLEDNRAHYQYSKAVDQKLHAATHDIVKQYSENQTESIHWEEWLSQIFYNEQLDGHNRYQALVRLAFISFNYRRFDLLQAKMEYLDDKFAQGQFYSKRLLLNYYHNRLMLHANYKEFDQAAYYGYLAIRAKTHDHILYVNNLSAVLLRQGKTQDAYAVLQNATAEMKATKNFHSKIGYVAFYLECLNRMDRSQHAANYANAFLKAYTKEVLHYRWHLFFSGYLETLLYLQQHATVLKLVTQYKLLERDQNYRQRISYLPNIRWLAAIAAYHEGTLKKSALRDMMQHDIDELNQQPSRTSLLKNLLDKLKGFAPEVINYLIIKPTAVKP